MASVLEPYQHRVETGDGLCRSSRGALRGSMPRHGQSRCAFTAIPLLERVPQFASSLVSSVLRPQASDVDNRRPAYGGSRTMSATRVGVRYTACVCLFIRARFRDTWLGMLVV
jgi:hypothetical protein